MMRDRTGRSAKRSTLPRGPGWYVKYLPSNEALVIFLEGLAEQSARAGRGGAAHGYRRAADELLRQSELVAERLFLLGPGSIAELPYIAEDIAPRLGRYVLDTVAAQTGARAR